MWIALPGFSFTTPVRMIDGIHRNPAHVRPSAEPSRSASFAYDNRFEFPIADLADCRFGQHADPAHFAGRHFHLAVFAFLGDKLGHATGRTAQLRSFAGPDLHIMNDRTQRNILYLKSVARFDIGFLAAHDCVALLKSNRRDYISFLAVEIMQKRDIRGAVRIVFN